MTEAAELIAGLAAGLEQVTKGEWAVDGYNTAAVIFRQHGKTHVTDWMRLAQCDDENANWKADADHIARCSPKNIRLLLDHIETLEARVATLADCLDCARTDWEASLFGFFNERNAL